MQGFSKVFTRGCLLAAAASVCFAFTAADEALAMNAGVNLSGLEMNAGTIPGNPNWDYAVPSDSELAYYESKGVKLIRLPVLWERLEWNILGADKALPLNAAYLSLIDTLLDQAAARGMTVMIDLHDYGSYWGAPLAGGTLKIWQFACLWEQMAAKFRGHRGLAGYDLMNEPNGLPDATVWPRSAQRAVDAIRKVDMSTPIYVEGDDWASAGSWPQDNGNLSINDPADKIIYEAHVYGDQDNSGTHFTWSQVKAAGVTVDTIAQRIGAFTGWCNSKGVACMIGEVGVGNDAPQWNTELQNGLAAASEGGIKSFTYWAGGPWWGSYPMSIEPQNGVDAVQMGVVSLY